MLALALLCALEVKVAAATVSGDATTDIETKGDESVGTDTER